MSHSQPLSDTTELSEVFRNMGGTLLLHGERLSVSGTSLLEHAYPRALNPQP